MGLACWGDGGGGSSVCELNSGWKTAKVEYSNKLCVDSVLNDCNLLTAIFCLFRLPCTMPSSFCSNLPCVLYLFVRSYVAVLKAKFAENLHIGLSSPY